jgi:quercetin dioxygenase-like cupin family protein
MATTVTRGGGESEAFWMLGGLYEVRVSGEETDDAVTVMEMTVPEGAGPPPHVHSGAEVAYVVEGNVRFHSEGGTFEAGPGSVVHFPAGTEETFEPVGGTVRLLLTYTPGGIDRFFKEAGEPAQRREVPPPMEGPPDFERLDAIARKHGLELRMPARA